MLHQEYFHYEFYHFLWNKQRLTIFHVEEQEQVRLETDQVISSMGLTQLFRVNQ